MSKKHGKMNCKSIIFVLALICPVTLAYGQRTPKRITITGTVADACQNPITNAVIFVDNVKTNVKTDERGFYRVRVNADAKEVLVFTLFNGVADQEINGRRRIDFILSGDDSVTPDNAKTNDEESVNVGYGTISKKDMTTQSLKLDARDPAFASYQTIYDLIRGRFPGVEVSGKSIKITGASSLNVSTQPLFVVDGVIVNSIDDISPQNVKTIEVLKGPAATAYGTRGSNGVIVITRMTGKDR